MPVRRSSVEGFLGAGPTSNVIITWYTAVRFRVSHDVHIISFVSSVISVLRGVRRYETPDIDVQFPVKNSRVEMKTNTSPDGAANTYARRRRANARGGGL